MLLKLKLLLIFLYSVSSSQLSFANEAKDKAEFKRLYAEFNELYANSEELDPIIEVAEKVYETAQKAYGKKHKNNAVVTYNLATLYDEKGDSGKLNGPDERKATKLYEEYFDLLDELNTEKDEQYLKQYIQYMNSYYRSQVFRSNTKVAENMLEIVSDLEFDTYKRADYEYLAAILLADFMDFDVAIPHFKNALELYLEELGPGHIRTGNLNLILARHAGINKNWEGAINYLLQATTAFESTEHDGNELKISTYMNLANYYEKLGNTEERQKYRKLVHKLNPKIFDINHSPIPIKRAVPKYPLRAAKNGMEGFVLVNFTVDKEGKTKNVKAVEYSHQMFVNSAVRAAQKYKYKPRLINEEPKEIHNVRVRIEFQLVNPSNSIGKWRALLPDKLFKS